MTYACLIFDLDGTISDPKDGIVRSFNYALVAHGFEPKHESELATYIGPPLDGAFKRMTQSHNPELIASLVAKYRERYSAVGFSENVLYQGMAEVLAQLSSVDNMQLGVCTSKRTDFAERILALFGIRDFFSFVDGGDIGIEKWQQLQSLQARGCIPQQALMIGDRDIDISAAHKNALHSAGVLWGYGSHYELSLQAPTLIFSNPHELLTLAPG